MTIKYTGFQGNTGGAPRVAGAIKSPPAGRRASLAAGSPGRKDTEVLAYVERIEKDLRSASNALRENASVIYLGIKKSSKIPKGIDKIPAARRQRRAMLRMARACEMGANAARMFRYSWYRSFGSPGSRDAIKKQGIEFT